MLPYFFLKDTYDRLRRLTYPGTDIFLVCFSLASQESLNSVRDFWTKELQRHVPGAPLILVGTQKDLRDGNPKCRPLWSRTEDEGATDGFVPTVEGRSVAFEIGASAYVECSALLREGIRDVFAEALLALVDTCSGRGKNTRQPPVLNRALSVPLCCTC